MSKKILIADQSDTVRSVAENLFRKRGFEVVSASDGLEALDLMKSLHVDLAFLNSRLPEMDGYAVSRQVKSDNETAGIKTVLLLSTSEIVNQRQFLSSLADETLNKPFTPKDLLDVTARTLDIEIDLGEEEDRFDSDGVVHLDDDVEELDLAGEPEGEIDFSTIFSDEDPIPTDQESESIILADSEDDDLADNKYAELLQDSDSDGEASETVKDKTKEDSDEPIRIAEDQFGLQTALDEPEIEGPHDYRWFVREMKRDLESGKSSGTGRGASSAAAAVKSKTAKGESEDSLSKTSFSADEIGSSNIDVKEFSTVTELSRSPASDDHSEEIPDTDSIKLSLAEKLLVKEVAEQLSREILNRLSRSDLRQMLTDVLASIKKM